MRYWKQSNTRSPSCNRRSSYREKLQLNGPDLMGPNECVCKRSCNFVSNSATPRIFASSGVSHVLQRRMAPSLQDPHDPSPIPPHTNEAKLAHPIWISFAASHCCFYRSMTKRKAVNAAEKASAPEEKEVEGTPAVAADPRVLCKRKRKSYLNQHLRNFASVFLGSLSMCHDWRVRWRVTEVQIMVGGGDWRKRNRRRRNDRSLVLCEQAGWILYRHISDDNESKSGGSTIGHRRKWGTENANTTALY